MFQSPPRRWYNRQVMNHVINHHLLQSERWGQLKSKFGWTPVHLAHNEAAALVLFKRLPLGLSIAYIPKGPAVDWSNPVQARTLLANIHAEAKKRRAIFLKIEPDMLDSDPLRPTVTQFLTGAGFAPADTIQPQTSVVIDLSPPEEEILGQMKQKTRYNIRLAAKKGVTIRPGSAADIDTFYRLSQLTAQRDGFGIHHRDYYQLAFELFAPDHCALLLAEFAGEPLAALLVFTHGPDAYYFYGASSNEQRQLMPTYLLQWEAMRWAKQQGCTRYDLWGIPNADEATLETEFAQRSDGLWGVYRFKRGFGGEIVRSVGAFDYVYHSLLYRLYRRRRGL